VTPHGSCSNKTTTSQNTAFFIITVVEPQIVESLQIIKRTVTGVVTSRIKLPV
jgi:hypothetical protein